MKSVVFLICSVWLLIGCQDDEDPIIPREAGEKSYQLPQGNHDYDPTIVEWYNKYHFYVLYRFEKKDVYWNNTVWTEGFNELHSGELLAAPADERYVGSQLEVLQNSLIDIYPDSLLECMPLKILLCSELWKTKYTYHYPEGNVRDSSALLVCKGFDFFALNGGGEKTGLPDETTDLQYLKELNILFLQHLQSKDKIGMPESFGEVSDYTWVMYMDAATAFSKGFINPYVLDKDKKVSQEQDFVQYLELITLPLPLLESEPDKSGDYSIKPSLIGALNPKRDVNGLVRRKYNILIQYLKEKGVKVERLQHTSSE